MNNEISQNPEQYTLRCYEDFSKEQKRLMDDFKQADHSNTKWIEKEIKIVNDMMLLLLKYRCLKKVIEDNKNNE